MKHAKAFLAYGIIRLFGIVHLLANPLKLQLCCNVTEILREPMSVLLLPGDRVGSELPTPRFEIPSPESPVPNLWPPSAVS